MKRIITVIASMILCVPVHAQKISVAQFREAPDDFSAAARETRRADLSGEACALVKISTKQSGFSFDAGIECISDIIYTEPGVWLYLPAGTRSITIAHKQYGILSRWQFPLTLESARVYEMTLKTEQPKPVRPSFNVDGFSSHFLQSHIGMEIYGGEVRGATIGINYTFLPKRAGFYTSVEYGFDSEIFNVFAGPAIRLLDSSSTTDWQLYAGIGYAGGALGGDFGTRFGWKSDKVLSRWDFSLGCQYWGNGTVVPYVGLGAGITGYTAAGILGIILCVVGGVL